MHFKDFAKYSEAPISKNYFTGCFQDKNKIDVEN